MDESRDGQGVSRRQLLRAGVWSAPVIVLATAAPAAALSPGENRGGTFSLNGYSWAGSNGGSGGGAAYVFINMAGARGNYAPGELIFTISVASGTITSVTFGGNASYTSWLMVPAALAADTTMVTFYPAVTLEVDKQYNMADINITTSGAQPTGAVIPNIVVGTFAPIAGPPAPGRDGNPPG